MWDMKKKVIFVLSIFSTVCTATKLDLSWQNLTKEKFFQHDGVVSDKVENATDLNLRGNLFDSFLDCSANLDKLQRLDLSQNILQRFFFLCKNEDNLISLNVSHNRLPFLNDTALTERISKLEILDLSFNLIEVFPKHTLQHMKNLQILSMRANPIGDNLHEDSFAHLNSLIELDLGNISSKKLPSGLLTPLKNLQRLNLALNPLQEIPPLPTGLQTLDISGTGILILRQLTDVPKLQVLTMNEMPYLEALDLGNDLKGLTKLAIIRADNCPKLKNVFANTTDSDHDRQLLPSLKLLSLKNCSIGKIDGNQLLPVMNRTAEVNIENNPLICDCDIIWILDLDSTRNHRENLRCESPSKYHGKRLYDIPTEEFNCNSYSIYIILWLCLGLLTLGLVIGSIIFVLRGPLKQWRLQLRRRDTVTYTNIIATSSEGEKMLEHCDITDYP